VNGVDSSIPQPVIYMPCLINLLIKHSPFAPATSSAYNQHYPIATQLAKALLLASLPLSAFYLRSLEENKSLECIKHHHGESYCCLYIKRKECKLD